MLRKIYVLIIFYDNFSKILEKVTAGL